MKKIQAIIVICFLIVSANSFAIENQFIDGFNVDVRGYGFQCVGFCSGNHENSEVVAKRSADLKANNECKEEGFENAVLLGEYKCHSYSESFGNIEITTYCDGFYQCE